MSVSRRTVLRGIGATVALPWMESLPIAKSTSRAAFPRRFAVLFMGNGVNGNHWWAKGSGAAMTLGRSLAPLESLKCKIIVINGLFNQPAVGKGIHPAQTGNLLSGAALGEGSSVFAATSVDQVIAQHLGSATREPSLTLGCEPAIPGRHETDFSLTYSSHIAWRSARAPVANEIDARRVFARLFANDGGSGPGSILDRVNDRIRGLSRSVSARDRARLDDYLTRIRDVERRVQRRDHDSRGEAPRVAQLAGFDIAGPDVRERARLMCDIIALAFEADITRIATLVLASDLSSLTYPFLGINEGHHAASHDDLSDAYERITRFHVSQLAYLAGRLNSVNEGDSTVLDHSCLLWLSNMWAGWKHDNMKLPVVLAGGLGGTLKTGRAVDCLYAGNDNRKLCSLYLSIMDRLGVELDRFGDAETRLVDL
jgi:hypothetical protein